LSARGPVIALLCALAAGCGGGGGGTKSATSGADVFATAGCEGCHTLKAANANGRVGPNLDDVHPSVAKVRAQVTNGGGGMPAFKGTLSAAQIQAVADYVAKSAGG
jgi:cytochrome c6